jgi:hypothetical protein
VIALSYSLGCRFSPKKVRCYDTEKFARTDDLSVLPELWEMALVASHQIVCTSGISAFDEHVVCEVRKVDFTFKAA